MTKCTVAFVRANEHDYDYRMWHEDLRLAYAHAVLDEAKVKVRVFDFAMRPLLNEEDFTQAQTRMAECNPEMFVFVVEKAPTNSPYYTADLICRLKKDVRFKDKPFIVYGLTTVGAKRLLVDLPIDAVITGEESDFLTVVSYFSGKQKITQVSGVILRDRTGNIVEQPPTPLNRNLDELPAPRRYYFDLTNGERHQYGYVGGILSSRGCYARCTFCFIRAYDKIYGDYPWRGRKPAHIADELLNLYSQGVREFAFLDPNFFGPGKHGQEWALQLAKEIAVRKLKGIAFSIYARANDIQSDSLKALKAAGLYAVFIGIESFYDETLRRYRKGVTADQNFRAIEILKAHDVRLRMGFIMFDEHTTPGEVEENLSGLRKIRSGFISPNA